MTVRADKLPSPGETVLGGAFTMGHGGKGANQAVAAKRLGGDVTFVCKVGKDLFGESSVRSYEQEGIDTSHILYSSQPSGVALINVDASAENSISVASGANLDFTPEDVKGLEPVIREAGILLLQLEIPVETVLEAARIASESGVYVILNPAPACRLPEEIYRGRQGPQLLQGGGGAAPQEGLAGQHTRARQRGGPSADIGRRTRHRRKCPRIREPLIISSV